MSDLRSSRYEPGASMAPHAHVAASLNVLVDGDFVERIGKSDRRYRRGIAALCPARIVHSQAFGPAGARQIIFSLRNDWIDYLADGGLPLEDAPYAAAPDLLKLGRRLLGELANEDEFSALAREALMLETVATFARTSALGLSGKKPPAWLSAVRDFLHANALSLPDMKCIARAAGRHEIHVAREFRRFYGTSVGAYLRQLKAEEAARLLGCSGLTVAEIAHECGFASHAHLCRTFKAQFGLTPSEYRAHNC